MADGAPILRKVSEHGLGHLLNPIHVQEDDRGWIEDIWRRVVSPDAWDMPAWFERPAVGREATKLVIAESQTSCKRAEGHHRNFMGQLEVRVRDNPQVVSTLGESRMPEEMNRTDS